MIILDIDDTLLDHSGAELNAATQFGFKFASSIPGYEESTFPLAWQTISKKHFVDFLAGKISFQEQRCRRIRDIFHDESISKEKTDILFNIYLQYYEDSWEIFPDVLPFIEKHSIQGIGIVSDGSQAQQEAKLKAMGIYSVVSFVITAESLGICKPDPRLFHHACSMAKKRPSEACYIGDNLQKDALGATAAGLRGIWLNRKGKKISGTVETIQSLSEYLP
ncbi:MAG: HAD family hydrolase [Pseudomonadota bacterium]